MDTIPLYLPTDAPDIPFLNLAHQVNLIELKRGPCPELGAHVERRPCACGTRDQIAVQDRSILVHKNAHAVNGYPSYFISDPTHQEAFTLVTWLTRHMFHTFYNPIQNGSLVRYLTPEGIFSSQTHETCDRCERHTLVGEPVFFLKGIVLSQGNKGPTLESVLQHGRPEQT